MWEFDLQRTFKNEPQMLSAAPLNFFEAGGKLQQVVRYAIAADRISPGPRSSISVHGMSAKRMSGLSTSISELKEEEESYPDL